MNNNHDYEQKINPERGFTGLWIPVEIVDDKNLSWTERCLYAYIHSLSKGKHGCFASNEYFAKIFSCSIPSINRYLANLKKLGLVKQISFDGRTRRLISVSVPHSDSNENQR